MSTDQFQQEWQPSEAERKADDLAKRYYAETEAYDRTVCTGPIRFGAVVPIGGHELALVNRNAIKTRQRIMAEAAAAGITAEEMKRAFSRNA